MKIWPPPAKPGTFSDDCAALVGLLADASVAAADMGDFGHAESLRNVLWKLVPDYAEHLPHYALAALGHNRVTLADEVLNRGRLPGPAHDLGLCVYGFLQLARSQPEADGTLQHVARRATDARIRAIAARLLAMNSAS